MVPRAHVNPSSTRVSQSSSPDPHRSVGGMQALQVQSLRHERIPEEPQLVVHAMVAPCTHANTSSGAPLQSSSIPVHVSAGAAQTLQPHDAPQVRLPVVPQLVMHDSVAPRQHVKPSSQPLAQSSSAPLQTSGASGEVPGSASLQSVAGTPPTSGHVASPNPSPSASRVV